MILVDSSVWIDFFRDKDKRLVLVLKDLLDRDLVVINYFIFYEVLNGAKKQDFEKIRYYFSVVPKLELTFKTWLQIEEWIIASKPSGENFGVVDLVIAAQSVVKNAQIWSLDNDFRRMEKLGFVRTYTI